MGVEGAGERVVVYSIGHSNHPIARFLGLLQAQAIEVLVDVRSAPYSRHAPQFSREALEPAVSAAGMRYLYLGRELGGRPQGEQYYDGENVVYERVAATDAFRAGLDRLRRGAARYRVAVMCSEEDPTTCHRYRLIRPELQKQGVEMRHIRGDGTVDSDDALDGGQLSLFGATEEPAWKSIRLASRRDRRPTSSEP